jgi:hypothetical protein
MSQEKETKSTHYHLDYTINTLFLHGDTITSEKYSTDHDLSFYFFDEKENDIDGYGSEYIGEQKFYEFRITRIEDTLHFYNGRDFYKYVHSDNFRRISKSDSLITMSHIEDLNINIDTLKTIYSFLIIKKDDNNLVLEPIDPIYKFTMLDTTSTLFHKKRFKQEFYFSLRN